MFRISIYKNNQLTNRADFNSLIDLNTWLSLCEAKQKFGAPGTYTKEIIDLDLDATEIAKYKKVLIAKAKAKFYDQVEDKYDNIEISLINTHCIQNIADGKGVTSKFTTMINYLNHYETWRTDKINEIKACSTMEQLKQINI